MTELIKQKTDERKEATENQIKVNSRLAIIPVPNNTLDPPYKIRTTRKRPEKVIDFTGIIVDDDKYKGINKSKIIDITDIGGLIISSYKEAKIFNPSYPYIYLSLRKHNNHEGEWMISGNIQKDTPIESILESDKTHDQKNENCRKDPNCIPIRFSYNPNPNKTEGGSKTDRSTVLGRITSLIHGSKKRVTRKKRRKPRSKKLRYKKRGINLTQKNN